VSAHSLRWRGKPPPGRIDASALRPDLLAGLDEAAISRLPIPCGSSRVEIGDLFVVRRTPAAHGPQLRIDGCERYVDLARGMERGRLSVDGPCGDRVGRDLRGGEITVDGNAGHLAGASMSGGLLYVGGSAGDWLGGPAPGDTRGLRGGEIIVEGSCGERAGLAQRRGLIAVCGSAGRGAGHHLRAGTIVVLGGDLEAPGVGMRRGTIIATSAATRAAPPATFGEDGPIRPVFLRLLWRRLRELGGVVDDALDDAEFLAFSGDRTTGGRGEVLYRSR